MGEITLRLSSASKFLLTIFLFYASAIAASNQILIPSDSPQSKLFIEAETAIKNNNHGKLQLLLLKLKDHPLTHYLERDWLIKQLSINPRASITVEKIVAYLVDPNNIVASQKLRYIWLSHLAKSNQDKLFVQFYQPMSSLKLRCRYLQIELQNPQSMKDTSAKVRKIWLSEKSLPKYCDKMISLWKNLGELSEHLIWQRMLLAADKKQIQLIRYLNKMLPENSQQAGLLLIKVIRNPSYLLKRNRVSIAGILFKDIALHSINKLAWNDPNKAIKMWKRYESLLNLSAQQQLQIQRSIGLALALSGAPEAEAWLASIANHADSSIEQWLLSSALTSQNWSVLQDYSSQKWRHSGSEDKWSYWTAKSPETNSTEAGSITQFQQLSDKRSYYGFLAARELKQLPNLNFNHLKPDDFAIEQLSSFSSAKRAYALYQLGRYSDARREWNQLIKTISPNEYVNAALLAHRWEWNHQAILTFAKSRTLDDVAKRFPLYLYEQYSTISNTHQVPLTWAYAITRQESAFKTDAVSSAGAQGLMQLTPSTARRVAKQQLKSLSVAKMSTRQISKNKVLHQPIINIQLGIAHLKEMLDYYQGNPVLATAAYNAGSGRVDQWLKRNKISDSLTWIEQIPYKETRDYVKNVLTYQEIYAQLADSNDSFLSYINDITIPTAHPSVTQVSAR